MRGILKMAYQEQEEVFKLEYESLKNGNVEEFKKWLNSIYGNEIYNFIKWLQKEGLKI